MTQREIKQTLRFDFKCWLGEAEKQAMDREFKLSEWYVAEAFAIALVWKQLFGSWELYSQAETTKALIRSWQHEN